MLIAILWCALLEATGSIWGGPLYWTSTSGPVDDVYTETFAPTVRRDCISQYGGGGAWGYRLGVAIGGSPAVKCEGLYLRSHSSKDYDLRQLVGFLDLVSGQFALSANADVVSHSQLQTCYWRIDGWLSLPLCAADAVKLEWRAGGRGTRLEVQRESSGRLASGIHFTGCQHKRFDGGGPLLGMDGKVSIGWGLHLHTGMEFTSLIGRSRAPFQRRATPPSNDLALSVPRQTILVPGFGFRLAGELARCWKGAEIGVAVGYELQHYWSALLLYPAIVAQPRSPRYRNFGFAGPYVTLILKDV